MKKIIDDSFPNLKKREIEFIEKNKKSNGLIKTIIDGVRKEDIVRVAKDIIKRNENVMIDAVYYNTSAGLLLFLADKKLDVSEWVKRREHATNKKQISHDALLSILEADYQLKSSDISVGEIKSLLEEEFESFSDAKKGFKAEIELEMAIKAPYLFLSDMDYNYNNNTLTLIFDRKHKVVFTFLDESIIYRSEDVGITDQLLGRIREFFLGFFNFVKEEKAGVFSTNSKFFLNMDMLWFKIYLQDKNGKEVVSVGYDMYLREDSTSNSNFELSDFLDCIYFNFEDLPVWLQRKVLHSKKDKLNQNSLKSNVSRLIRKLANYFG